MGLIDEIQRRIEQGEEKPFYFTFGSWEEFPYQNGYLIVYATNIREAAKKFRAKHPDKEEEVLNCADYYSKEYWDEHVAEHYSDRKPFEIIG